MCNNVRCVGGPLILATIPIELRRGAGGRRRNNSDSRQQLL